MNKTIPRIEKTTKDKALKILTAGVPSLSINYENRRQVFVESKHDVFFYEKAYDKLRINLVNEISLDFISSGIDGSGSSDQVKEIVNKLSGYGNKCIFGIVDWDSKNVSTDFVKVLGEGKRYSIENYIFDPILISAFLLREKIISRDNLGLKESENYTDFKHFDESKLQVIVDSFLAMMDIPVGISDIAKSNIKYTNRLEIQVPKWYLFLQGHDLEALLKKHFSQLKKYIKEDHFKKEVIRKVIDDIPEFIPLDILELFLGIQNQ